MTQEKLTVLDLFSGITDSEQTRAKQNKTKQNKKRERTEKGECERKKRSFCGKDILLQMADIWNAEVQSKLTPNQKSILTPKRKELLTIRWLEDFQQDIRAWQYYCEIIGKSDFCLGKIEGKNWTIDLTWAISSSEHVAKVLEGGFSGGKHPSKPSECNVPEFVEAWDYCNPTNYRCALALHQQMQLAVWRKPSTGFSGWKKTNAA